jgi:DNA topoisomerase I
MRLRRSDPSQPGIKRRRRGRGFSYSDPNSQAVRDRPTLDRIRALAVPPAWSDVWICRWPNGHIQAVGTDAAGRRQYRYHSLWREERDREKFLRVEQFAAKLPKLRRTVRRDLAGSGLGRERVLAAIVRLLDVGFFRVGGEEYAHEHETFGVASLRKEHVRIHGDVMDFEYPAKDSISRSVEIRDAPALDVVAALRRRRSGGSNLFAYKHGRRWVEVHANDVNDYIKAALGGQFSAKDFRTWSATVFAAAALAENQPVPEAATKRHRAETAAMKKVAETLGNTPAVSRSSYVDPRVVERFEKGQTVGGKQGHRPDAKKLTQRDHDSRSYRSVETAVIELVDEAPESRGRKS